MTITEFIEARAAEREHAASGLAFACRIPGKMPDFTSCGGPAAEAFWATGPEHQILAVVQATRRIMARHHDDGEGMCGGCPTGVMQWDPQYEISECPELRDLASIDSNHPDYDPAWAPERVSA